MENEEIKSDKDDINGKFEERIGKDPHKVQEKTFLAILRNSVGGGVSLYTLYYFLQTYSRKKCLAVFGTGGKEIPRSETKVRLNSFINNYISMMGISDNPSLGKGGKESDCPLARSKKKRVLLVFGGGYSKNAWNTPLLDSLTAVIPNESPSSRPAHAHYQTEAVGGGLGYGRGGGRDTSQAKL